MGETLNYFRRAWLLYTGRKKLAEPYVFSSHEIISTALFFRVSYLLQGIYLNLHPTLYAVCIFSDGIRKKVDGGVNIPFLPGQCTLHYVDKTDRQSELLKINENTLDAARIMLAVKITYRISDPIKIFDIQKPVETLFSTIQADLKEYIRTRPYEELIGNNDSQVIDSDLVAKYIKQQHSNRYPISKVFTIIDVVVHEKEGDPVFIEKQKNYKSQVVDGETKMKVQELNKKIASQEAEMEKIRYKYKSELDQQKAQAEVEQNTIRQKVSIQEMEIQKMRDELRQAQEAWEQKQAKWLRSMEVIDSAVKSPYYREMEGAISAVVNELKKSAETDIAAEVPGIKPEIKNNNAKNSDENLDTLTDRLRNLLDRQKSKD